MADKTGIAWCDATWNPFRGCSRVSLGCKNCYAERIAARFSGINEHKPYRDASMAMTAADFPFFGFAEMRQTGPRWTGQVELIESQLEIPLRWRKPRRIFVNSMSDTFHERIPEEAIDQIFAVMARRPQHTFIVCTKRASQAGCYGRSKFGHFVHEYQAVPARTVSRIWPLRNVILLASVEDQQRADERIPELLATPAAVRGISLEPMLGPVDLRRWLHWPTDSFSIPVPMSGMRLDWVIVGGESGPGARPCNVEWIRDVVRQCREAGCPCFVKQLGARPVGWWSNELGPAINRSTFRDRAGADPAEWPEDLRVREWPEVTNG